MFPTPVPIIFLIGTCSGMISKGSHYYTAVLDACIDVLNIMIRSTSFFMFFGCPMVGKFPPAEGEPTPKG